MLLKSVPRVVLASHRPVRLREPVVGGTPFGKQRQRALEMGNGSGMVILGGVDASETKLRTGLCEGLADQRVEQPPASLEIARFEQRFRQREPCGQITGRLCERALEPDGGVCRPGEALQHDTVQVVPLERVRRQSLHAGICLVHRLELLPRLQHPRKGANGRGIGRGGYGLSQERRDSVTGW